MYYVTRWDGTKLYYRRTDDATDWTEDKNLATGYVNGGEAMTEATRQEGNYPGHTVGVLFSSRPAVI